MALGLLALAMYISCIFHVVCASFSALATRKLADTEANSSGIWALVLPTDIRWNIFSLSDEEGKWQNMAFNLFC